MSRPPTAADRGIPPDEVTGQAVRGFFTGAARVSSSSLNSLSAILSHTLTVRFNLYYRSSAPLYRPLRPPSLQELDRPIQSLHAAFRHDVGRVYMGGKEGRGIHDPGAGY